MKMYFKLDEFLVTDHECELNPSYDHLVALMELKFTLNIARALVGCPIVITSGYRSEELNELVGGVPNSFHLVGRAADMTCKDMPKLLEICSTLLEEGIFEECIYYPDRNIIHVAI